MTSSGESSASIWLPVWLSWFYAAICSRVQTPTQSGQCVITSPSFSFLPPACQLRTRAPPCGHVQDQTPQSHRTGVLHWQYHSHRYWTLPVCTEIDTQTLAGSRSSAHCQRARVPGGLRSRCKALGRVLSQKHSFVNLVPQGMLCRGTSL